MRLASLLLLSALFVQQATGQTVQVVTPTGIIAGRSDGGVETFKGLPYAAPPVGAMRWRAPGDPKIWSGVRDGSQFGPVCVQRVPSYSTWLAARPQSEDCLTLNIWRPAAPDAARQPTATHRALPVMVWIHGGSNTFGSGSEPFYDGTAFARRGIIVITINYRLGHLGFFGHPSLGERNGNLVNYGLLDQIAALKWVNANVAAFGGDPSRVTIFGESAGGAAVLNLLVAPSARGLFGRAIVQSGGGLITRNDAKTMTDNGRKLATALGLENADAEALRALPAARFIEASLPRPEPGFGAVPGGAEITEAPLAAIRAGRAAGVPLLIGVNSNEGSLVDSWGMKDDQVLGLLGGRLPAMASAYGGATVNTANYARRLYGDVVFLYPARAIARGYSRKAPVWLYYFDYVPEALRNQRSGVSHAAEIPFVFDLPADALNSTRTAADQAYANGVNACFAAFAIEGQPSTDRFCAKWTPFVAKADNWFAFRAVPAEVRGLAARQLDAIGNALRQFGLD